MTMSDRVRLRSAPVGWREVGRWSGLQPVKDDAQAGPSVFPGETVFTYPQGPLGARSFGFDWRHDGTFDWRPYEILQFQVKLPTQRAFDGEVTISIPRNPNTGAPGSFPTGVDFPYLDYLPESHAKFHGTGDGWQTVSIPISSFDYPRAQVGFLKFIQQVPHRRRVRRWQEWHGSDQRHYAAARRGHRGGCSGKRQGCGCREGRGIPGDGGQYDHAAAIGHAFDAQDRLGDHGSDRQARRHDARAR